MASSSSSSSSRSNWIYDIFLSFRGQDTRRGFTDHLHSALTQAGIRVFRDDDEIQRGEEITEILKKAIESSQIAIVILSRNYASSRWCLDEQLKIMECRRELNQVVLPVFYDVDPSDVRRQKGSYGDAMRKYIIEGQDRVLRWENALREVAVLAGYDSRNRYEAELIRTIVDDVLPRLNVGKLFIADHPVGIESRVHDVIIEWWKGRSQNVLIIGLWGMGGIGKTTVAKAIYNEIGRYFEGRSFLANIREISKQDNDQVNLQKQLICDIIKTEVFKIPNIEIGKNIIRERFPYIKALVVLDDVDGQNQLKALCGSREWFDPGSIKIITTRDLHILNALKANYKYKMREMDETEALELFSWHAFKQAAPFENFIELLLKILLNFLEM